MLETKSTDIPFTKTAFLLFLDPETTKTSFTGFSKKSVFEKGAELIELGVPVQELTELPILSKARRAKQVYDSTQIQQLRELGEEFNQTFHKIRLEYAKFKEHAQ